MPIRWKAIEFTRSEVFLNGNASFPSRKKETSTSRQKLFEDE